MNHKNAPTTAWQARGRNRNENQRSPKKVKSKKCINISEGTCKYINKKQLNEYKKKTEENTLRYLKPVRVFISPSCSQLVEF